MIKDEQGNRRFYGIYRGIVTHNLDPLKKNRIRMNIPQVLGDQVTNWAWGFNEFSAPKIGQGVWVMFEGGDPAYPVWMGSFGTIY
jgi:hypothetical protein